MDHYSRQIIIDRKLHELRAQGDEARLARLARREGTSLRSRLTTLVVGWRTRRADSTVAGQERRPVTTRPA